MTNKDFASSHNLNVAGTQFILKANLAGVSTSPDGIGVVGTSATAIGFLAGPNPLAPTQSIGTYGESNDFGVFGFGTASQATGVHGNTAFGKGIGVWGNTSTGIAVLGTSDGTGFAGKFVGDIENDGNFRCTKTITAVDVQLSGGDCAENFDAADLETATPGTLMIFTEDGLVVPNTEPYDKRVAGVVSGAGDYQPAIVLNRQKSSRNKVPIALLGRVYCKADAQYSPINIGDLLTTSPTVGHAMKAEDPTRSWGAVIGKAMQPLVGGQSLIPILIALR